MAAVAITIGLFILAAPVLAITALVQISRVSAKLERLERRLAAPGPAPRPAAAPRPPARPARDERAEGARSSDATAPDPPPPADADSEETADQDAAADEAVPEGEAPEDTDAEVKTEKEAARDQDEAGTSLPATPQPLPRGVAGAPGWGQRFEEGLASRWLVWLGGLALALGGIFLVKYSIDKNLLSPAARILLGLLFGAGLVVAGDWLRRRPLQRAVAAMGPNFVPQALSAAGLVTCFGSLFAAYALYGLIGPLAAFLAMAAVATAGLALSLLHGPLVAALGILGAFAVPLLVESEAPSAWSLFPYLWCVAASALAVVRFRDWGWLAWLTLLGTAGWAQLWLLSAWQPGDAAALAAHLVMILLLFAAPRHEQLLDRSRVPANPFDPAQMTITGRLIQAAALAACPLLLQLLEAAAWGPAALGGGVLLLLLLTAAALRLGGQENLLALAAATALAAMALWVTPGLEVLAPQQEALSRDVAPLAAPLIPPELLRFCASAAALALLFAAAGFIGLWRSRFPGLWASVSAVVPLTLLGIVYWRLEALGVALPWGAMSLALAAVALAAATGVARQRAAPGMETALGCYSLAVSAGITLAVALALEEKWWPIALALQLPAAGWIDHRLRIPFLRPVYLLVAGYVLVRLGLEAAVPTLPSSPDSPFAVLTVYGLPAAAFALAAHLFAKRADDLLVLVLQAGALGLGVLLVTFEIDQLVGRGDGSPASGLLEMSLNSIAWLGAGWALARRDRIAPRPVARWGARLLVGAGAAQVLLGQVILESPLATGAPVGAWPIVNHLLLAYGAPAAVAFLLYREALRQDQRAAAAVAGLVSIGLQLLFLTLEVRHLAHGPVLSAGPVTEAEGYAYSLVWLVYAGLLLTTGVLRGASRLRHVALALMLFVVAKVFLWDMSWLTGLYRVASFICLGLSLVGVGLLYQRLILRAPAPG